MKLFSRDEITNKNGQRIYMFAKQPGKTEMEKCLNFLKEMKLKSTTLEIVTLDNQKITVVAIRNSFEVFDENGVKVGECDECQDCNPKNLTIDSIAEDLADIGFNV